MSMEDGDHTDNEAQGDLGPALGSLLGARARLALWEEQIPFGEPVITGGDGGAGIRHCDPSWARQVRNHRVGAGIAYFYRQSSGRTPKAGGRILDGRT